MTLQEKTIGGLHDFLMNSVLPSYVVPGSRAIDLGAGSGALAVRLRGLGFRVVAADINAEDFKADVPFVPINLDDPAFAARLGEGVFDLVTAVEIIEHVENSIGFLRNVRRLLNLQGLAILTTPNVDNAPARAKFLLTGKLRMMDGQSDSTHISPVFWDLLTRQYLPRAGLQLAAHHLYPPNGYKVTRRRYAWGFRILTHLLPGEALVGDNHVLVLRRAE